MKVLVFVKATPLSEKGILRRDEQMARMFAEMGKFNEQLAAAGIMQEADGLKPSSFGKRIKFSENDVTVVDGPFAETKELVAGYWIWTVGSVEEAVEWAKQCPNPMPGEEGTLEIRPTYSMDDFDDIATDAIRARNTRLQKEMDRQQKPKPAAKSKAKKAKKAKKKPRAKK